MYLVLRHANFRSADVTPEGNNVVDL